MELTEATWADRLPTGWRLKPLEEISGFITKGATPTTYGYAWQTDGVVFLRSECVSDRGLDLSQASYISEEAHAALNRGEIRAGDLLVTITGYVGRSIMVGDDFGVGNINQHIARVRITSPEAEARYVMYHLSQNSVRVQFESITTGQAYPQISLKQVREYHIPLPPLPEQRAITTALSDVDALIDSLDALIAKKRAIKTAAMQQLLTGRRRLPGFGGEWPSVLLGACIDLVSGQHVLSSDYNSDGYGLPYLTGPSDFDLHRTVVTKWTTKSRTIAEQGDVLLTVKGSGSGSVHLLDIERAAISRQLMAIKPRDISGKFLFYYLDLFQRSLARIAVGNLIPGLSRRDVLQVECPHPDRGEQQAIATVLSDMDGEIAALEARREKTEQIKQGMMQELLTGRTRLATPEVEPARMAAELKESYG